MKALQKDDGGFCSIIELPTLEGIHKTAEKATLKGWGLLDGDAEVWAADSGAYEVMIPVKAFRCDAMPIEERIGEATGEVLFRYPCTCGWRNCWFSNQPMAAGSYRKHKGDVVSQADLKVFVRDALGISTPLSVGQMLKRLNDAGVDVKRYGVRKALVKLVEEGEATYGWTTFIRNGRQVQGKCYVLPDPSSV